MKNGKITRRKNAGCGVYYPRVASLSAIRRFAEQIVERFHPDKIILFGSYAYGTPTRDSDVDLLVVMPTRNQVEQAVRIDEAIEERGFPLDLLVRTPKTLANRLRWGDCFMQEIVTRGKVLYERRLSRQRGIEVYFNSLTRTFRNSTRSV